ncbi:MAG TPA: lytic transglycosylase domain-containing protein [Blastocatellia bacterium]|nr:lytic transglycosylase domain-containing protein [Blastocatellia bacterium]
MKRLLSAGATTLALSAFWMVTASQEKLLPQFESVGIESAIAPEKETSSEPRGLSRQRKDFDKALGILETAASGDERLGGYLTRVQKRVRGEADSPENGAVVRSVAARNMANRPVKANTLSAAESASAPRETITGTVWAKLKNYFERPKADSPGPVTRAEAHTSSGSASDGIGSARRGREQFDGANRLTVGDVAFEKNAAIERWINYYTASERGRQTMKIGIDRSGAYIDMARAEFQRLGVPEDLVWLAHVESVWHSTALSPAAARGLWQFIPRTATDYGLTVSQEYDERLDPAKQTQVAAAYLRDLYTIFGDWALAMAAYNCGEPRVMNAIVRNGRADFWELHQKKLLPEETLNYVPKILAAIEVAGRSESFGF